MKSTPWPAASAACTWRCRSSGSRRSRAASSRASDCPPRRSRSRKWRASWWAPATCGADGSADCSIIDAGHVRERDLAIEMPAAPLEAVMSGEVWTQIYDRLAQLVREHRTTLVFVNTRRLAERLARHLSERLGEEHVAAHHGSLAKETRLDAEQRLKRGRAEGAGGDRVAGARHRHRRRRPRVPDRLAALDQRLPAARRALGPLGGRHAQGSAVPAVARRPRRMHRAARRRAPRRAGPARRCRRSRSTCWRSRSSRKSAAREWDESAAVRAAARRLSLPRSAARGVRRSACACSPRATARAAAATARSSITTR